MLPAATRGRIQRAPVADGAEYEYLIYCRFFDDSRVHPVDLGPFLVGHDDYPALRDDIDIAGYHPVDGLTENTVRNPKGRREMHARGGFGCNQSLIYSYSILLQSSDVDFTFG